MRIRAEEEPDWTEVHAVHVSAFERRAETDLVDALRGQAESVVSLVAERGGTIVGHILFTLVIQTGRHDLKIMGLAPLGVDPRHHRQGVGSALVRAGLEPCRGQGVAAVVVLWGTPGSILGSVSRHQAASGSVAYMMLRMIFSWPSSFPLALLPPRRGWSSFALCSINSSDSFPFV
ncbi:MAG: N-acetyltransferase [Isosphaeraceae bacterium]